MTESLQSRTVEWLRYPLMLLVVLIHTDTALLNSMQLEGFSSYLYYFFRTIIRVAVPLFFIFSGYWFFFRPESFSLESYKTKLRRRAKTLFLPYIFWNYFVWGLQMTVVALQGHADWIPSDAFHLDKIADVAIGYGDGYQGMPKAFQLWFLRDLMILCLLAPQLHLLLSSKRPFIFLIFATLYLMPWPANWHPILQRFPSALLFFCIGAYLAIHRADLVKTAQRIPRWAAISATLILMAVHIWQCAIQGRHISLAEKLFSIVAVIPTLQAAAYIVRRGKIRIPKFLSDSYFLLFVLHPTLIYYLLTDPLTGHLAPSTLHFWMLYSAELAVPVIGCAILHFILSRMAPRTTALLTGGRGHTRTQHNETTNICNKQPA